MIRVLHIVSKLSINSGVMNMIMNYYRYIDRSKIQFDFLYFEERTPDFKREIENLGGKFYFVNKPSLKNLLATYTEFNIFFQKNCHYYSAIHLHEIYLVHFIGYFCKKYGIQRLITHAHATKYSDNPKNALRNKIMCIGLKKSATDYFACSKAAGNFYYGETAVKKKMVKIIPNAIDIEKYQYNEVIRNRIRKTLNVEKKFVIGHVGRMVIPKNQKFLIHILEHLKHFDNNALLLLVGDGPLRNNIESEVDKLGLNDSVIFLGIRSDIPELLMGMDLFLLPSLYEGLPVVCVEAQATGLKCLLSSTITTEANLGNCYFLDINNGCDDWIKCIMNRDIDRKNVDASSFDVRILVKYLESLYFRRDNE